MPAAPEVHHGALPLGSQASALSSATLASQAAIASSYPPFLPNGTASAVFGPHMSPGTGVPSFPVLLPPGPFIPQMHSQWPLIQGLNSGQPPYLPQLGYSVPPYPLGSGHLLPHLPHHLPQPLPYHLLSNPQSPVSPPGAYPLAPAQGLSHLPYHLPPYLPNPLQTLIPSQPTPLNPYGQLYVSAPDLNLQVKPEPRDAMKVGLQPCACVRTPAACYQPRCPGSSLQTLFPIPYNHPFFQSSLRSMAHPDV